MCQTDPPPPLPGGRYDWDGSRLEDTQVFYRCPNGFDESFVTCENINGVLDWFADSITGFCSGDPGNMKKKIT